MKRLLVLLAVLFSVVMQAQEIAVRFSCPGGFYDSTFYVALSCEEAGCVIRYTTNGNAPSATSKVYSKPLLLDEDLYSHSNIFTIQDCADSLWYVPKSVKRCIVIRAAAFDQRGNCCGEVVTNSYFIKSLGCDTHGLPVVSLCADSLDLFDYERGIMILGAHFDSLSPGWSGNCFQRGREWERCCNMEFYESDNNIGVNQMSGLRLHGDFSRLGPQKALKLYARKEYSKSRFGHRFFKDVDNCNFKHLVLKPFCQCRYYTAIQDEVCMQIARTLNVETLASRFVTLYLNGEYWGIYILKERPDEHFISEHFGYASKEINMIDSWTGTTCSGDNTYFIEMMEWLLHADLTIEENYQHACSLIDIDCFIDYNCLELFVGNCDWPHNNMRCWQYGKGEWRWVFYDGDDCLHRNDAMFKVALTKGGKVSWCNLLFNRLLANESFRNRFYQRFGELLVHEFDYRNTKKYIDDADEEVKRDLDKQVARFGNVDVNEYEKLVWSNHVFLRFRALNMAAQLYGFFYQNGWRYGYSVKESQQEFKMTSNSKHPTFLFRMARQFKEWRYVELYFEYEKYHFKELMKSSRVWQWLKS
jgi:hypothetical protein